VSNYTHFDNHNKLVRPPFSFFLLITNSIFHKQSNLRHQRNESQTGSATSSWHAGIIIDT
jgi:hypothetical protein